MGNTGVGAPAGAGGTSRSGREAGAARFLAGDGLRCWGMLAVFLYHAAYFSQLLDDGTRRLDAFGVAARPLIALDLGLSVFFVLSGYLIARPFARAWVLERPRPSLRRYVDARVRRIVPAFWLIAGLSLLWFGTAGDLAAVVSLLTFTGSLFPSIVHSPMSHSWSLYAEIGYYVSVPVLVLVAWRIGGSPRRKVLVGLALLGALMLLALAARRNGSPALAWQASLPGILYAFLPGTALALVEPLLAPWLRGRARLALVAAAGVALLAAGSVLAYAAVGHPSSPELLSGIASRRIVLVIGFAFGLCGALLIAQWGLGYCPRALSGRIPTWMGVRSYPFYLLHLPIIIELSQHVGDVSVVERFAIVCVAGIPLAMAGAAVVHVVLEAPVLERRWPWHPVGRRASAPAGGHAVAAPSRAS